MICSPTLANKAGAVALRYVKAFEAQSRLFKSPNPEIPHLEWSDIQAGEMLGSGSFSTVYRVQIPLWDKQNKNDESTDESTSDAHDSCEEEYAIKSMNPKHAEDPEIFIICALSLVLEAKMLANIQHKNIIKLYGVRGGCVSKYFHGRGYFMVMEKLHHTLEQDLIQWKQYQKGNINKRMKKSHRGIPSLHERLEKIALGVAQAMEYLHSKHIIHRDIKPANVGFDCQGNVKLYDFGTAREMDAKENSTTCNGHQLTQLAGTRRYMSPETFLGKPYGLSADIYSYGLFLWVISTLEIPFKCMSASQIAEQVMKGNQRPSLELKCFARLTRLKELLESCWDVTPEDRPPVKTVCKTLKDEFSSTSCKGASPRMKRMRRWVLPKH